MFAWCSTLPMYLFIVWYVCEGSHPSRPFWGRTSWVQVQVFSASCPILTCSTSICLIKFTWTDGWNLGVYILLMTVQILFIVLYWKRTVLSIKPLEATDQHEQESWKPILWPGGCKQRLIRLIYGGLCFLIPLSRCSLGILNSTNKYDCSEVMWVKFAILASNMKHIFAAPTMFPCQLHEKLIILWTCTAKHTLFSLPSLDLLHCNLHT